MAHEQVEAKTLCFGPDKKEMTQVIRAVTCADFLSFSANINQEEFLHLFWFLLHPTATNVKFKETLTFKSAQLKCVGQIWLSVLQHLIAVLGKNIYLQNHRLIKHCCFSVLWKCIFQIIHWAFQSIWTLNHCFLIFMLEECFVVLKDKFTLK